MWVSLQVEDRSVEHEVKMVRKRGLRVRNQEPCWLSHLGRGMAPQKVVRREGQGGTLRQSLLRSQRRRDWEGSFQEVKRGEWRREELWQRCWRKLKFGEAILLPSASKPPSKVCNLPAPKTMLFLWDHLSYRIDIEECRVSENPWYSKVCDGGEGCIYGKREARC